MQFRFSEGDMDELKRMQDLATELQQISRSINQVRFAESVGITRYGQISAAIDRVYAALFPSDKKTKAQLIQYHLHQIESLSMQIEDEAE
jgi:hypothetical protein